MSAAILSPKRPESCWNKPCFVLFGNNCSFVYSCHSHYCCCSVPLKMNLSLYLSIYLTISNYWMNNLFNNLLARFLFCLSIKCYIWTIVLDYSVKNSSESSKNSGSVLFFSSIRYHGSSSSIKCHVYHHVERRRHTPVVCNESREPHASHNPSRPVAKRNNQQTTHTSHYRSPPVKFSFKGAMTWRLKKVGKGNKFLRTHLCRSQFLTHRPQCQSKEPL